MGNAMFAVIKNFSRAAIDIVGQVVRFGKYQDRTICTRGLKPRGLLFWTLGSNPRVLVVPDHFLCRAGRRLFGDASNLQIGALTWPAVASGGGSPWVPTFVVAKDLAMRKEATLPRKCQKLCFDRSKASAKARRQRFRLPLAFKRSCSTFAGTFRRNEKRHSALDADLDTFPHVNFRGVRGTMGKVDLS